MFKDVLKPELIVERLDIHNRIMEGLPEGGHEIHYGGFSGNILIKENGYRFYIDPLKGQKTGFFLDQRDNRKRLQKYCKGKSVLNCFSYSGGFSVYATEAGAAAVVSVDISGFAINLCKSNFALNEIHAAEENFIVSDVFKYFRKLKNENRKYDVIILDPPSFAPTAASVKKAAKGYSDINAAALQLLNPGGVLLTCSCSTFISPELFLHILLRRHLNPLRECRLWNSIFMRKIIRLIRLFRKGFILKALSAGFSGESGSLSESGFLAESVFGIE